MNTKLRIPKVLIVLCSAFTTTAVFGQTTYTWIGPNSGDIGIATNWNPNGVPNPVNSDAMQWDGRTTGDLSLLSNTGVQTGASGGSWGLNIHLTANQTNAVNIYTTLPISSGVRLNTITIDSGAGAFSLGDNTLNVLDILMGGVTGQIHNFVNNSVNAATIYPNVRWRFGGGGIHTFAFAGSGNWAVNNFMIGLESGTLITKSGSGTMTWTGTNVPNAMPYGIIYSPVDIESGALILKSSNLLSTQNITHNGTLLEYAAPAGACTLSGAISGTGALIVSAGTLVLAGANTYGGNTTVSAGKLVFQGTMTGTGNITVNDSAKLGVFDTGTQITPATLTLGTSAGCTLEFNNVNGTTTAPLAPTALSSAGTITVNINSGTFSVGQSYPLLTWTTGSPPTVSLGVLNGYMGNLSFTGNTLKLNITGLFAPPTLNFTTLGNNLQFSWNASFGNYKLQSQTNSLNAGLGTNWVDYPGGSASPVIVPMDAMNQTVFFRLVSTP